MALMHELPKKILEHRELAKVKSTYADALPRLIQSGDRPACTRVQPDGHGDRAAELVESESAEYSGAHRAGREIRAAFVASKGRVLLSADYSQIELRILAHLSEDPVLVDAFRSGEDIHSRTAQEVFGVGPMAQTREHRRVAKGDQFRRDLRSFGVRPGAAAEHRHERRRRNLSPRISSATAA